MNIKKYILKCIKKPQILLYYLDKLGLYRINDYKYLQLQYENILGKKLNIENPITFNEKMQWLKLHDRNSEYIKMVDKYEVKKYVADIIGKEYIIPTIGVYNKFDDINFNELPNQFVMKCTHDSGGVIICKDKNKLNIKETKKKINKCLNKNFYYLYREWPYKNVKPKIIIEKYMENDDKELIDYKLFCFNGELKIILVCSERTQQLRKTFLDKNWNIIDIREGGHEIDAEVKKPINLNKMKEIAQKLAKNIKFLRVDFYEINGNIFFGEITFYPNAGYEKFSPEIYDKILGEWIKL